MTPDTELLRQFARDGNEAAFTEVVRRHTDLVYSAALRMVAGDAHLAKDAAQWVFSALANQAGALAGRANIVGWLYTTTHHSASTLVRAERRRRAREQIAFTMREEPTVEIDWSKLQPVLDEEVCRLNPADREAVLLRFFQGKSHREVGEALGLSEDLARKRIERAIEKLRASFSRRGLGVSSALLAETITAYSVQAAPAGLAANLASLSLASVVEVGRIGSLWKIILLLTMKTKIAIVTSLLVISLLLVGAWHFSQPAIDSTGKTASATNTPSSGTARPAIFSPSRSSASAMAHASGVQAPALPAVEASSSGTATIIPGPSGDLNATIQNVIQLVAAKDYDTLVLNYLPQKGEQAGGTSGRPGRPMPLTDPAVEQMFQSYADILTTAKNSAPTFSADGRTARIRATPDAPQAVVFVQMNGTWRISGIETELPDGQDAPKAPAGQKKNADPNGGGFVPDF